MLNIQSFFEEAIKQDASDLHLVGAELPMLRLEGELKELATQPLDNKDLELAIIELLTKEQQTKFKEEKELDFGYELKDVRFRVNLHQQQEKIGLAARVIPSTVPSPKT